MKSFFSAFWDSLKELKNVRCLTITGIFVAIYMVLEMFSINLQFVKINFAFLSIAVVGMLFGPTVGFFSGLICDVVGYIVSPSGGYLPLYTLVAGLQGMIYGAVLYIKYNENAQSGQLDKMFFARVVIARLVDVAVINLLINTALNLHYGFIPEQGYFAAIVARIAKNAIELLADIPLLFLILPTALTAYRKISPKPSLQN